MQDTTVAVTKKHDVLSLITLLLHLHRISHESSQHFTPQQINTRDIFTALLHITTHHTISAMEVPVGNLNLKLNSKAKNTNNRLF